LPIKAEYMSLGIRAVLFVLCAQLFFVAATAEAQDLGHKLPGLIGLDAGRIPPPGLLLIDRVVFYQSDELRDRNGNIIPIQGFALQALSNATGFAYTTRLSKENLLLTVTAAVPVARFSTNVPDRPEASFDRFGLADIYIQPLQLGWRKDKFDLVGSYAIYLPTGISPLAGGKGVSAGQVTHQFSAGGSTYRPDSRAPFVSVLAGYELNLQKRSIDITRGDTFQVQGGVGVNRFNQTLELGLAGFGLWQVRDDRGSDLPPVLRGARDRVLGLGPEAAILVNSIRSQFRVRYEWDLDVRSRPKGSVLSFGVNFIAWKR
jgi:hypothetical protein